MTLRRFPEQLARSRTLRPPPDPTLNTANLEDRRTALLDAAETMLAEKGILQAGLQEIGARIGLAPYAVRAQYGSRDMVIEAVIDRHLDRLIDRLGDWERLDTQTDPALRLRLSIDHLLSLLYVGRKAQRVHMAAAAGASPHLERSLKLRQRHLAHYFAGLIAAALPETQGRSELAMPIAMNLMAMACWHILWFRGHGALGRQELGALLFHMVTAGARAAIEEGIGVWTQEEEAGQ